MEKKKNIDIFPLGAAKHNCLGIEEQVNKYEPEDYNLNIENKNDSHALLAQRVLENSSVLDVGCATGIIGKLLKENKNCTIDGIELDPVSFKIAKTSGNYQEMYHFSIIGKDTKAYQNFMNNEKKYDYILFADILEHLICPWEVIYEFSKKLTKNGQILISIPNINHISILKNMMNNQFNYNTLGILDSTHLRFFTALSFFEMMENYNEMYEIPLNVDYFAKTTYTPSYVLETSFFSDENYQIVQNLFSLTLAKSKEEVKYLHRPKKKNKFENFLEEYNQMKLENSNQKKQIENLQKELDTIYNSKRYNFISKLANIKNKIIK